MKRIYLHIFAAAMAPLTLAACDKEDTEPQASRDCPSFSARIDHAHTRAIDDYWELNDQIGISGSGAINSCHVTELGDGDFVAKAENEQIFFTGTNEVTFNAYYPWTDFTGDHIPVNTADQDQQKSFDFLWASATGSRANADVKFKFTHKMSKVTFVFKNGTNMDVSALHRIRLNGLAVEGTFDPSTGETTTTSTGTTTLNLTNVKDGEAVTPFILLPQVAESVKLEIYDTNSQYFICNLNIPDIPDSEDKGFFAGYNYTYTITVNKTGLQVTGATLSDWINEAGEGSEASSADD